MGGGDSRKKLCVKVIQLNKSLLGHRRQRERERERETAVKFTKFEDDATQKQMKNGVGDVKREDKLVAKQ